jgi:thioredoxin-like negative regulator of GroEL
MFGRRKRSRPVRIATLEELDRLTDTGKPVFVDFYQVNCTPCQIMDGLVSELADEFDGSAHVAKVDVTRVEGAARRFRVRATPTFLVLAASTKRRNAAGQSVTQRWRATGLVRKDALRKALISCGAEPRAGS